MRWQFLDILKMQKSILLSYEGILLDIKYIKSIIVVALKTFLLAFVSFLHSVTFLEGKECCWKR
ncbi:hypothetical protein CDL12_06716 [Handroanthus impetiginosus]|uniref:Uncharacterized protein n=1 Tax=Handroanthus impetiginosus TaxID=429701 RepID=A0A2G9HSV8_9LAMI|nr:hypothetical protein CDL12_06716 [Handroanthus impetiginosus]